MRNDECDYNAENDEDNNKEIVCKSSCKSGNVSKTKRDMLQADQQSRAMLTADLLYEVAKPKPPPRMRKKKSKIWDNEDPSQLSVDPKSAKSILLGGESKQPRLETTSRKESCDTSKAQDELPNLRNSKVESPTQQNTEYLTISPKRSESNISMSSGISRALAKSDTSSNTTSSSGYFSRRSDSASLSSSNSNVSSTSSNKRQIKVKKQLSSHIPSNQASSSPPNDDVGIDCSLEEDVFPVKSWVESSEYASIAMKNAIKENNQGTKEAVLTQIGATEEKTQDTNDFVFAQVKIAETIPELIKKPTKSKSNRTSEMERQLQTRSVTNR